ncbi:aminoglycoside phosphotransferase family protein [Jeotgalibacillus campisalis]|uniref:Hydrogenase expression protein HypB n=1 Tax=Jeotgalibacillus campisalis TaxID=220754 RepID=A0A0C2RLD1_9BACL|nr:aminoglycoside phosphotransferase family protein [Jeotgalibacillus campisalis]KIL51035.1 hypothetical protein KR50_09160 [Jeotgalibacillus campisalis]
MEFQDEFIKSVHLYAKEKGEDWLMKLPFLIQHAEQKWNLTVKEPYTLSINYVAPAERMDGERVVIKICLPGDGFTHELRALNHFKGNGMVRLLDWDEEKGILLLQHISPGTSLKDVLQDEEACKIAARVIKRLAHPAPAETVIPTVEDRRKSLGIMMAAHPEGVGPITFPVLSKALNLFSYLTQSVRQPYLLHGDFHHYNVLLSGEKEWVAIDPKGLIGEIEYDLIQFLLNCLPDKELIACTKRRVAIFTEELDLNEERLLQWGYCHTVLSTAWSVDEQGGYSESFYQMIDVFERLMEGA